MRWTLWISSVALGCVQVPTKGLDSGTGANGTLLVVTFNAGTTLGVLPADTNGSAYGIEQAALSDAWYGDGLAWTPAVDATRDWFARFSPDLVVFQEVFSSDGCATVPAEARTGFVCEDWSEGDPTVAVDILGPGYQVACHPGKPDKCAAVHERVGRFAGCEDDYCPEGLRGETVSDCGTGARVGTATIERDGTPVLQLTNIHGSSGLTEEDQACRMAQTAQVFDAIGDGAPAVSPTLPDVLMGDLNTDPYNFADFDASARDWAERVPLNPTALTQHGLRFVSPIGPGSPASYEGLADIDHVFSDTWSGACDTDLLDPTRPHPVYDVPYFDHRPVVCELRQRAASPRR